MVAEEDAREIEAEAKAEAEKNVKEEKERSAHEKATVEGKALVTTAEQAQTEGQSEGMPKLVGNQVSRRRKARSVKGPILLYVLLLPSPFRVTVILSFDQIRWSTWYGQDLARSIHREGTGKTIPEDRVGWCKR